MTDQQAFNKAVRHTLKQGVKSMAGGSCAYRGVNGRKCAFGILIPNKEYLPKLEGWTASGIISSGLVPSVSHLDGRLFDRVQEVHDLYPPHKWEALFRSVAELFGLTFPKLKGSR